MSKRILLDHPDHALYDIEKEVLYLATTAHLHAFPSLLATFQSSTHLFLALEYCPGGDLISLLERHDHGRLSQEMTLFYTAELILALHSLHGLGFVHRYPYSLLLSFLDLELMWVVM